MDIFVAKKERKQAMILTQYFLLASSIRECANMKWIHTKSRDKGFQWLIFSCITAACAAVILVKTALLGGFLVVLSYSPAAATRRSKIFF